MKNGNINNHQYFIVIFFFSTNEYSLINTKENGRKSFNSFSFFFFFFLHLGLVARVFTNGLGDPGSILGWVIPKTLKMVLDTYLLNTRHYKIRIKGKIVQSRERSSVLPYTSV